MPAGKLPFKLFAEEKELYPNKCIALFLYQLTKIPEEQSKLVCLGELDISHNALNGIPDSIGELEYLVHLIANNDISQLPKFITSLRKPQQRDPSGIRHPIR